MATSVPRAAYALPRPPRARRPVWSNAPAGTSRSSLQSILARLRRAARVRRRPPDIAAPILLFSVTGGAGEGRRCLRRRSPGHDLEASSWTGVTVRRPTARPPAAHDRSHHMVRAPRTGMPARCVAIVPRPKSAAAAFGRVHKGRSKRPHSYPISAGCKTATQAFLCVQKSAERISFMLYFSVVLPLEEVRQVAANPGAEGSRDPSRSPGRAQLHSNDQGARRRLEDRAADQG
jgi:hypothetical protein